MPTEEALAPAEEAALPTAEVAIAPANPEAVIMLTSMGFTKRQVQGALKATGGDAERAADWLFSRIDDLDAAVAEVCFAFFMGSFSHGLLVWGLLNCFRWQFIFCLSRRHMSVCVSCNLDSRWLACAPASCVESSKHTRG